MKLKAVSARDLGPRNTAEVKTREPLRDILFRYATWNICVTHIARSHCGSSIFSPRSTHRLTLRADALWAHSPV